MMGIMSANRPGDEPVLRRNVLIFHLGALGDFVLTWPLAMALSRLFAQSRIVYITHGQKAALAEKVLRVDSADIEGGWHELYCGAPKLPPPAAQLLAGAHRIFSFVSGPTDSWISNVRCLEPAAEVVRLEPRPPEAYRGHFTDFVVEQLGSSPAIQAALIAMIRAINDRGIATRATRGEYIVIHPGSGGQHKCWPRDRFLELIRLLTKAGKCPRVVLGEAEIDRWPASDVARFQSLAEVVRPTGLIDLFDHLTAARVAVMNDSGPAHLSSIIGTPTLCLFGPSNPSIWRPIGPHVSLIHQDPLDTIEPAAVLDQVLTATMG
jgi:heptosyltransferase III